jgi:hypothetical protein
MLVPTTWHGSGGGSSRVIISAVLVRASIVAVSLLVLAWVSVLLRDREVGQAAAQRMSHDSRASQTAFGRDMRDLEAAELLNPDSQWQLYRSYFWLRRGRGDQSALVAEALVRREPANIRAWILLFLADRARGSRRSKQALAQVRRLDPLGQGNAR